MDESQKTRDDANIWLARLSPLLSPKPGLSQDEVEKNINTLRSLQGEASDLQYRLGSLWEPGDVELANTFGNAVTQLPSIESDFRSRLASQRFPGPRVDLESIQERLAEREAQQELGIPTSVHNALSLSIQTSPRNIAAALGLGVFALGWNAFTLMHCILMVGGMWRAMGPVALFMLLFYSIFFGVGFAMIWGVIEALSVEEIELTGRSLLIKKSIGKWVRTKMIDLDPESRAVVGIAQAGVRMNNGNNRVPQRAVLMTDSKGKEVVFAAGATEELRTRIARQVNEYLGARV
ncbi:MAG: hypothetical protein WCK51_00185 [Armatimonadota bacterium]